MSRHAPRMGLPRAALAEAAGHRRIILDARLWLGKSYTGHPVRNGLRQHGISAVIPQAQKTPRLMDWALYRERNVVERWAGRLKEYRRPLRLPARDA